MNIEDAINHLINELDSMPDSSILIPAPEPRFEGHMIRVRDCAGPEWLQLLRKRESSKVSRYRIRANFIKMRDKGYFRQCRYVKLCMDVLTGKIYEIKNT